MSSWQLGCSAHFLRALIKLSALYAVPESDHPSADRQSSLSLPLEMGNPQPFKMYFVDFLNPQKTAAMIRTSFEPESTKVQPRNRFSAFSEAKQMNDRTHQEGSGLNLASAINSLGSCGKASAKSQSLL